MAYNLGTARGVLEIIYKGTGAKDAKKDLDNLADSSNKSGSKVKSAGNVMGAAGIGIAAALLGAANEAAKFEQSVDVIGAVSGASAAQMELVRAKALQLGNDTAFGATQASDAMGELIKAGLSVDEVLGGAADATVALAAAGEIDLSKAATIASNAMNQFGIKAQNMPHVADLIAGAANASAISVKDFGLSLAQVGAVANLVGFSFDDTAVAIAALGNAGIRGSDAGTSLKTMFVNLVPQTKKQIQMFDDLGLSQFNTSRAMDVLRKNGIKPVGTDMEHLNKQIVALSAKQSGAKVGSAAQTKAYAQLAAQTGVMSNQFFDAQGKIKPMTQVFGILQGAMKGLSKEQQIMTLQTLFGTDAIRASAIAAQIGKGGFTALASEMTKVSAQAVAAKKLDNLKGDIEKMKSSMQTAAIVIGTVLIPALRDFVSHITSLVNKFAALSPRTRDNIVTIALWTAGTLIAISAIIKLVSIVSTFIGILKNVYAGLKLVAAVVRLNGAMALLMARDTAVAAVAWVRTAAAAAAAKVQVLANAVAMRATAAATAVWAAVNNLSIVGNIRSAASWVATTAAMVAHRVAMIAGAVATGVMTFATAALGIAMAIATSPITLIVLAIALFVGALIYAYKHSATFRTIVQAAFNGIKIAITLAVNVIKTIVVFVWNFLSTAFKFYFNLYKSIAITVWNAIVSVIRGAINVVKAIISFVVRFVLAQWNQFKALVSIVSNAFSAIVGAIKSRISAVVGAVTGIVSGIVNKVKSLAGALVSAGRDAIQGLINGITGMFGAVMNKARDLANSVKDAIKSALKIGSPSKLMDLEVGVQIAAGMINGMDRMHDKLRNAAAALAMVPVGAMTGVGSPTSAPANPAGAGMGNSVIFEAGAIPITALPGMNESQVGEFTARRIGTALATRTQAPRVAQARR